MLIPLRTDRRLDTTPWMNATIIAINVIIHMALTRPGVDPELAGPYLLDPHNTVLYQYLSYQFLHGGAWHLLANMAFLWTFGNSVEDRLGKLGYLAFYLAGGVVAGLVHVATSDAPVLGASGAVCAVTGAYLALFPRSNVTLLFVFFLGTFEIPSMWLILLQIGMNVVMDIIGSGGVAYRAHLGGYGFGFVVGMALLWSRLLPREPFDLLALIDLYRRRQVFKALRRKGYQPWVAPKHGETPTLGRPGVNPHEQRIMELRAQIAQSLSGLQLERAAQIYGELLEIDPGQVMGRKQQLDLANQLMSSGRHETAARAYELFLSTYRADPQREEIELILALLYTRYLDRRQRARELLSAALPRLHDREQKNLAEQMLTELSA